MAGVAFRAGARSLGAPLRLRLDGRGVPAGSHGGTGRVQARADRRHARGEEGACRLPGRGSRERPELARAAGRGEAARYALDFRLAGRRQSIQGISDANAAAYTAKHGIVGWHGIRSALDAGPACHRLQNYWSFADCRYRKAEGTCSEPQHFPSSPLPRFPAHKGSLIQAAYALFLFVRDNCEDDFIGRIDRRLAAADPCREAPDRGEWMGKALLEPLG